MNPRVFELVNMLDMEPHPEGGYLGEVYRSSHIVLPLGEQRERSAVTMIYYLTVAGAPDSWHRVIRDEVWHYYEGAELELFWIEQGTGECHRRLLGNVGASSRPVAAVPGGCWQAARTTGAYTLVGCDVAPGFEWDDYQLLREIPEEAGELRRVFPELAELL